jgi:hypothetical protein
VAASKLEDDRRGKRRDAAGTVAFAIELRANRGVVLTRLDQVPQPCKETSFPIRTADTRDRRADRSLSHKAATPRDPYSNHSGHIPIEIHACHQSSEQRFASVGRQSVP